MLPLPQGQTLELTQVLRPGLSLGYQQACMRAVMMLNLWPGRSVLICRNEAPVTQGRTQPGTVYFEACLLQLLARPLGWPTGNLFQ